MSRLRFETGYQIKWERGLNPYGGSLLSHMPITVRAAPGRGGLLVPPPILQGADALHPAKALGEVTQGGKAQDLGDEREGMVCLPEKKTAFFKSAGDQAVNGRHAELPAEGVGQIILVQVRQLSQLLQVQVFLKMLVDITPDQAALQTGPGIGGLGGEGGGSRPLPRDSDRPAHSRRELFPLLGASDGGSVPPSRCGDEAGHIPRTRPASPGPLPPNVW